MEARKEQGIRWYSGLTRYHWLVLAVAAAGWMFDTMDQWLYVLARQPAVADLLGRSVADKESNDSLRCVPAGTAHSAGRA